ncbi:MAG: protoporphyrinogen oxidase HemJ [Legionella sp.]|nr:protoporphyrinogen oxidase HemJ [Legionella sp.]
MLIIKAFHLIALVAWFAGLFYLPRLFVYHAQTEDKISDERFIIMERRLYYGITWPAAILTTFLGLWLLLNAPSYYLHATWMQVKLLLVMSLWMYHLTCGHFLKQFNKHSNQNKAGFYRIFNEIPTVLLICIVLLVVVKPF